MFVSVCEFRLGLGAGTALVSHNMSMEGPHKCGKTSILSVCVCLHASAATIRGLNLVILEKTQPLVSLKKQLHLNLKSPKM